MNTEPTEVDLNKIAAELIARTVKDVASSLYEGGKSVLDDARVRLGTAFTRYLDDQLQRRSFARTIVFRDQPKFIYDFYVKQDVKRATSVIKNADAESILAAYRRTIITGTGGMGKSMLLRHLFIDTARTQNKVPVFIELKNVNSNGLTFQDILIKELSIPTLGVGRDSIEKAFRRGLFVLLLDGMDEVSNEKRDAVSLAIQDLARQNPQLPIIVTSRPDDRFIGWSGFAHCTIEPLSIDKVAALVSKVPINDGEKLRFLVDLKDHLWEKHKSFLSNPLLLTIMLLTYSRHANVPTSMHLFYAQVFDTLWNLHDATKDGFKRTLECKSLHKDQFLSILEGVAFKTYWESYAPIEQSQLDEAVEFGMKQAGVVADYELYINDLVRAVCVLNREGLVYTYAHRSFQEYYSARFVRRLRVEQRTRIMSRIVARSHADQVLHLLWEMEPQLVEREVLIPALERIEAAVVAKSGDDRLVAYLRSWCGAVKLMKGGTISGDEEAAYVYLGYEDVDNMPPALSFVKRHYRKQAWDDVVQALRISEPQVVLREVFSSFSGSNSGANSFRIPASEFETHLPQLKSLSRVWTMLSSNALDYFVSTLRDIRTKLNQSDRTLDQLLGS